MPQTHTLESIDNHICELCNLNRISEALDFIQEELRNSTNPNSSALYTRLFEHLDCITENHPAFSVRTREIARAHYDAALSRETQAISTPDLRSNQRTILLPPLPPALPSLQQPSSPSPVTSLFLVNPNFPRYQITEGQSPLPPFETLRNGVQERLPQTGINEEQLPPILRQGI